MMDDRTRLLAELRIRAGELNLIRFGTDKGDWVQSKGPRGGSIWTHSVTKAVRHQKNKPSGGGGGKKEKNPAGAKARATPAAKKPAAKAPPPIDHGKPPPGHQAPLAALAKVGGLETTDALRAAMPEGMRGEAFDKLVLDLHDRGLVNLSRESDQSQLQGRAVVRDHNSAYSTVSLTEEGKRLLGGEPAPAAKKAAPAKTTPAASPPPRRAGLRSLRPPPKPKQPHPYESAIKSLLPDADAATLADPAKLQAALLAAARKKPKAPARPKAPAAPPKPVSEAGKRAAAEVGRMYEQAGGLSAAEVDAIPTRLAKLPPQDVAEVARSVGMKFSPSASRTSLVKAIAQRVKEKWGAVQRTRNIGGL